jgi:hypothetical protein
MRLSPWHRLFVVATMALLLAAPARGQFTPMPSGPPLPILP